MRKNTTILAILMTLGLSACVEQSTTPEQVAPSAKPTAQDNTSAESTSTIQVKKLEGSPAYADASIALRMPEDTSVLPSGGVSFEFDVENYDIGAQTDSPNAKLLANSGKGQHIHFILNNQPYSAHYDTAFTKDIPDGIHHFVAFLSRSYHESVKNENSVFVTQLAVGDTSEDTTELDILAPTLIYSRPKGTYSGEDTKNILLDFFVLNTELSEDGDKVKAVINGEEFLLTEWAPYVITGLPMGEVTIELSLIDAQGELVYGLYNEVSRTVTLTE